MPAIGKVLNQVTCVGLLPPKTDTGGTAGTGVDVTDYEGIGMVVLATGAAAGSGIVKVLVEDSADNSSFAAVTAFGTLGTGYTANTSGSNQVLCYPINLDACRRYVRASTVLVSGTSLIIGASLHAIKKVTA